MLGKWPIGNPAFRTTGSIIMTEATDQHEFLATLTADIVSAHVSNNSVATGDLPQLIQSVYASLANVGGAAKDVVLYGTELGKMFGGSGNTGTGSSTRFRLRWIRRWRRAA